jgi:MFS family permease
MKLSFIVVVRANIQNLRPMERGVGCHSVESALPFLAGILDTATSRPGYSGRALTNFLPTDNASLNAPNISRTPGTLQAMVLIVANVLPTMGIVSLIPVIPQLFTQFGGSPHALFLVPAIITAPSICIALLSPLAGVAADKIGRRPMLLWALLFYSMIGCAPLFLHGLLPIIASRVCLGITEAVILTTVSTMMGDYFKGEVRHKWLSYQNAIGSLLASGLTVAGGVLAVHSWRAPFGLYALAAPILIAALLWTWEPAPQPEEDIQVGGDTSAVAFPWMAMLLVYAVTLLGSMIFFVEPLQLGVIMNAAGIASPATIGNVSAITGFALPLGAYLLGRVKRLNIAAALAATFGLFACGLCCLSISRALPGIFAGAVLAQFACGVTFPLLSIWAQSKLHFSVRARGMGPWVSCFFIGQFLSTSSISLLTQQTGAIGSAIGWYAGTCAVAAIAAVACALLFRHPRLRGNAT